MGFVMSKANVHVIQMACQGLNEALDFLQFSSDERPEHPALD
jgi:hypothetical protein